MIVENVSTVLKDIKVTKKGINLTLEDVRLKGEQLQDLASLIGEKIFLGVSAEQMGLFDEDEAEGYAEPVEFVEAVLVLDSPKPDNLTDEEAAQELGLS